MGQDVDEMLAYETPKVVRIRDRTLGVLKYSFVFIIFCYVFVWQLMFKGAHFQMDTLSGVARMQLQHPVKQCNPMDLDCSANFTSLQRLSYCSQYIGKKNASIDQEECKYFDALDLLTPMDGGQLIPSFIETYDQLQTCTPNARNHFKCSKKYAFVDKKGNIQKGPGRAKPKRQSYVADIESFTLLIDHSFRVETGAVEYDDYNMQGYWLDCSKKRWTLNSTWLTTASECEKKPIACLHKDCKRMGMVTGSKSIAPTGPRQKARKAGRSAALKKSGRSLLQVGVSTSTLSGSGSQGAATGPADAHEVYSLKTGDVLSLRTLYAMAGRSLDDLWFDPSTKANMTSRKRGTVLVVNIHYNNLQPFTLFRPMDPPEYVISVTSRPVEKYKQMKASQVGDKTRELTVAYGTLIIVQSSGTIGVFRMIHMLIVVSTSLGLLAAAGVVTDVFALYVLPMRDEYNKAKFQETADMHDLYVKREEEEAEAQSRAPEAS